MERQLWKETRGIIVPLRVMLDTFDVPNGEGTWKRDNVPFQGDLRQMEDGNGGRQRGEIEREAERATVANGTRGKDDGYRIVRVLEGDPW